MATKVQAPTLILSTLIHRPTTTEQHLRGIQPILLRELCPEPVLNQLLRGNVRQDFTGCLHRQDKPAGVWLTEEHIPEEDMAATLLMAIPTILPRQELPEDIIAAASLGILSGKDVRTALVRVATHGTDQNALHSLPRTIREEATIIVIPPVPLARINTAALRAIIGTAVDV